MRGRLGGLWQDEGFAGWCSRDGRPGLSAAQLATVSVLQLVPGLSGRQAAGAVRCRAGFTYAPGLEPGDPGFAHGVLTDFRGRAGQTGASVPSGKTTASASSRPGPEQAPPGKIARHDEMAAPARVSAHIPGPETGKLQVSEMHIP
jgi:hypothetical protein